MKTRTPFVLLTGMLFFLALGLTAQPPEPTPPVGPVAALEFEETTFDFGTVEQGGTVTHVFTFTNTGNQPLIISDAKGSCGCTVPQWPKGQIQPGETASITVEFNTKGKMGKQSKRVTLTANTDPPQTFLFVVGEILPPAEGVVVTEEQEKTPALEPDCFAIYPNPAAEVLKLELSEQQLGQKATVSIVAQSGQLMAQRTVAVVDLTLEFDVSHYPPGTYYAQVQIGEGKSENKCFVVAR